MELIQSPARINKTSVLIVDSQPLMREALACALEVHGDFTLCGWAEDAIEAIQKIETLQPQIAIITLGLCGKAELELIRWLKSRDLQILTLVYSDRDEAVCVRKAFAAGARGYVTQREGTETLLAAISYLKSGHLYVNERTTEILAKSLAHIPGVTKPLAKS